MAGFRWARVAIANALTMSWNVQSTDFSRTSEWKGPTEAGTLNTV
jgi:hypothetical protein